MLLPENVHPENSIYYNGAIVLDVLLKNENIEMLDLFQKVSEVQSMSFPIFILCLDWLYLIDAAELINKKVVLCL